MVPHILPAGSIQKGKIRAMYRDSIVKEFVGGLLTGTVRKKAANIRLTTTEWCTDSVVGSSFQRWSFRTMSQDGVMADALQPSTFRA